MALGLSGYSYPTKPTGDSVSISCCRWGEHVLRILFSWGILFHGSRLCKLSFGLISKSIFFFLQCMFQGYWNSVSLGRGLPHRTVAEPVTMAQERKNRSNPSHRHIDWADEGWCPEKNQVPRGRCQVGCLGWLVDRILFKRPSQRPHDPVWAWTVCAVGSTALLQLFNLQQQLVSSVVHGSHTELSAFRALSSHEGTDRYLRARSHHVTSAAGWLGAPAWFRKAMQGWF